MRRRDFTNSPPLRRKYVNEAGLYSLLPLDHPVSLKLVAAGMGLKLAFQKEFFRFEDLAHG